ncbi:MAG TPA: phosphoribosylamine--glycine ligase [Firmicutes bacterium]|nr:phosphoribosylamine--glycine ligase [Candidatus Fermentithermobacillaceae bacterium]
MNVLVTGSGGREHALAWRIARSPSVRRVFVAPGNPGTASTENAENVALDIAPSGFEDIARFSREKEVELVVVGPENHLADGLADYLRAAGINVFGPGKAGTMLEASKSFGMEFARRHGIPHPSSETFDDRREAEDYVKNTPGPWVIKTDGLALGKGVTIATGREAALETVRKVMDEGALGEAGRRVVFQEFLEGQEVTAMCITDGEYMVPLPLARDHKRVGEGDTGPMTGGMGAFSPVDLRRYGEGLEEAIRKEVLERAVEGLRADGIDYRGVLYAGLMLTRGGPKVLEFNVRFGDPETQCVLPRLEGDFARVLLACAKRELREYMTGDAVRPEDRLRVKVEACATVVMASAGYPGSYKKGVPIHGLALSGGAQAPSHPAGASGREDVIVFHAGTKIEGGTLVTSGGRVLSVTALAPSLDEALRLAYDKVSSIEFEGAFYRRDIGR